jgi:hypothetical protein
MKYLAFIFLSLLYSCMTVQVNHMINNNETRKYLNDLTLKSIDINKTGTFRLNLLTNNKKYYFKDCYFPNLNNFDSCPTFSKFDFVDYPFHDKKNYTFNNKKGFFFENYDFAFFAQNLKFNYLTPDSIKYYFSGFPEKIFLSDDTKSRILIYTNKYNSKSKSCELEEYDHTSGTYFFKKKCNAKNIPRIYKPMKKVLLKNLVFIRLGGNHLDEPESNNELYIFYREGPVNWTHFYREGFSKELPVNLYYLLIPPAIIYDIITLPLQKFIGKNLFPTP